MLIIYILLLSYGGVALNFYGFHIFSILSFRSRSQKQQKMVSLNKEKAPSRFNPTFEDNRGYLFLDVGFPISWLQ